MLCCKTILLHNLNTTCAILLTLLSILDGVIHYHVDWVKSNIWREKKYTSQDQMYWVTHGIDQGLHFLTYVLIITVVIWRLI